MKKCLHSILLVLLCGFANGQWVQLKDSLSLPMQLFTIKVAGHEIDCTVFGDEEESYLPSDFAKKLPGTLSSPISVKLPGIEEMALKFESKPGLNNTASSKGFATLGRKALSRLRLYWDVAKCRIMFEKSMEDSIEGIGFNSGYFNYSGDNYLLPRLTRWTVVPSDFKRKQIHELNDLVGNIFPLGRFGFAYDNDGIMLVERVPFVNDPIAGGSLFGNQIVVIDFKYKKIKFNYDKKLKFFQFLGSMTGLIVQIKGDQYVITGHLDSTTEKALSDRGVIGLSIAEIGRFNLSEYKGSDLKLAEELVASKTMVVMVGSNRFPLTARITGFYLVTGKE